MNILVTGGAGFIGSHVVDSYIELGHNVIVVDNLSTGSLENLNPKAKFYQLDIRDDRIEEIFKNEKINIVNHHAAQMDVRKSVEDPIIFLTLSSSKAPTQTLPSPSAVTASCA